MLKSKFKNLIILLTLAILLAGVSGCKKNPQTNTQTPATNTQQMTNQEAQATTTEIDMSKWKTYKNEEFGFSLRYPEGTLFIEENDKDKLFKFLNNDGHFWVRIRDNPNSLDAKAIMNDFYEKDTYGYQYEDSFVLIDNIESYKQGRYDLGVIENFYIPQKDKIYKFNFEFNFNTPSLEMSQKKKDLIKQVISTFKTFENIK